MGPDDARARGALSTRSGDGPDALSRPAEDVIYFYFPTDLFAGSL
jgi:hypothetical protein